MSPAGPGDRARGRDWVRLGEAFRGESWILDRLETRRCILADHFRLQHGDHAGFFLRFRAFAADQEALQRVVARAIACLPEAAFTSPVVLCPESAGYDLGRAIAAELDTDFAVVAVDRNRRPTARLARGVLPEGRPVVVVNDVVTTGASLAPMLDLAQSKSALPPQIVVFATQGPRAEAFAAAQARPLIRAVHTDWPLWAPGDCPICKAGGRPVPAAEFN